MTESKFRERRSAHRDETAAQASGPAVETAPPASEPEPSAAREPQAEAESGLAAGEGPRPAADEELGGPDFSAYLDQLAQLEVPEPTFLDLVGPHIEDALRYLGQLPLTPDGERRVLPQLARREIDLLGIVEDRTRGNLTPPEQEYLQQALDQLRTLYLKASA